MNLDGAVAVITGGARRLGRHMAVALASEGADVAVNYRSSEADARATAEMVRAQGRRAVCVQADVSKSGDVKRLLETTVTELGQPRVLIVNASTFHRTPIETIRDEDWDDLIDNNLRAAFLSARAFGLSMRAADGGVIILLADTAGTRPWIGYTPYSVAKAGVIALTQALARELAPAVRVNAIAPGPILFPDDYDIENQKREIDRTLLKRKGEPENISQAAIALIRNDYITGALLPVDGGRTLA
jgi:NAD(P)-dependent dehydrogenase (short-subunit alcohol dehydrogenase family)